MATNHFGPLRSEKSTRRPGSNPNSMRSIDEFRFDLHYPVQSKRYGKKRSPRSMFATSSPGPIPSTPSSSPSTLVFAGNRGNRPIRSKLRPSTRCSLRQNNTAAAAHRSMSWNNRRGSPKSLDGPAATKFLTNFAAGSSNRQRVMMSRNPLSEFPRLRFSFLTSSGSFAESIPQCCGDPAGKSPR